MSSTTLLVLQHIACEPPAAFEDELRSRGLDLLRAELDEGDPLPDWREFDATIVMGGPMGAYEEDTHPWLAGEKRALRDAAEAGHPIWGVCLGAQLLAGALGARVYPGPEAEVGVLDVHLTPEAASDPVFGESPASFAALQWHGDTFDLPDGATLLASSPAYPHQAFRYERAYGLQFHLEVSRELAAEWGEVPAYAQSLEAIRGPGALDRLIEEVGDHADAALPLAHLVFGHWLERVAGVSARSIG